ncbi:MAG: hypothetical protein ACTSYS_13885 [Promethearchaeota archaeon]
MAYTSVNANLADAVVRALDLNQRAIKFFENITEESLKLQEKVEQKLDDSTRLLSEKTDEEIITKMLELSYHEAHNILRCTELAQDRRKRRILKDVISLIERTKGIRPEIRTRNAVRKLLELLKIIYTDLLDEHIRMYAMMKINILQGIGKTINEASDLFNKTLRKEVDSERTKSFIRRAANEEEEQSFDDIIGF